MASTHIGTKARRNLLAKRAKDPLKLVILRDMWLTDAERGERSLPTV